MTKPSDGYFLAKRQIQDAILYRIEKYEKELDTLNVTSIDNADEYDAILEKIKELELFRNYVRNVMLWDKSQGD